VILSETPNKSGLKTSHAQSGQAVFKCQTGPIGPKRLFAVASGQLCNVRHAGLYLPRGKIGHVAVNAEIFGQELFHKTLKCRQTWADHFHDIIDPAACGDAINNLIATGYERLKAIKVGLPVAAKRNSHDDLCEISQLSQRNVGMIATDVSRRLQPTYTDLR